MRFSTAGSLTENTPSVRQSIDPDSRFTQGPAADAPPAMVDRRHARICRRSSFWTNRSFLCRCQTFSPTSRCGPCPATRWRTGETPTAAATREPAEESGCRIAATDLELVTTTDVEHRGENSPGAGTSLQPLRIHSVGTAGLAERWHHQLCFTGNMAMFETAGFTEIGRTSPLPAGQTALSSTESPDSCRAVSAESTR